MKRLLTGLLALLLLLVVFMVIKAVTFHSKQIGTRGNAIVWPVDTAAVNHLSGAIKIRTVSYDDIQTTEPLDSLLTFLRNTYPTVFSTLKDTVLGRNLLLKWEGTAPDLPPAILYAHMDVVPIEQTTINQWKHQPFSGDIADGYIWGRGAIDDKGSLISIFEAVNRLATKGFKPQQTLYFAFGSDEEIGGDHGAAVIAEYCKAAKLHFGFYLDEGGIIGQGLVPNVKRDVALIGTSEKGYVTFDLTVNMKGGHSSRPPKVTAIDVMAAAIGRIHNHPFQKHSCQSIDDFIQYVGPEMATPHKFIFANSSLLRPIILSGYAKTDNGNAMVRTTGVTTVFDAGLKENVIPSRVSAKVNFRVLPGETVKEVQLQLVKIINDPRVEIQTTKIEEPSMTTSTDSWGFKLLQQTASKVLPDVVVSPFLMIGSTDSKHFEGLTDNIYRFFPTRLDDKELSGFHGINERIKVSYYMETIAFYQQLLQDMQTFSGQNRK